MIRSLFDNKYLFLQMFKREVQQRYRGSQFGFLWAFFLPILMLLVYTFVFGFVLKVRWGIEGQGDIAFGLILFSGLILHSLMAETINTSVGLISGNTQFVKKVVFPLEILSLVTLANAFFHMLLSLIILIVIFVATGNSLHWTIIYVPLVLAPFIVFLLGISWFVSVLGLYSRDLSQITGVMMTVMLFLGPILYPFSNVPDAIKPYVLWLNPLTIIVEQFRAVLLFGEQPNWYYLGIYLIAALLMLAAGIALFKRTRDGFADVI